MTKVSSRAKKKRESSGGARSSGGTPEPEPPEPRESPIVATIFGMVIFFAAGVFGGIQIFESWTFALICGATGAILAAVLVWRGEELF